MISRRTFGFTSLATTTAMLLSSAKSVQAADPAKQETFAVTKTPEEWKKLLTPAQYHVLRDHGTERAFTSPLDKTYTAGNYHCAGCNKSVFNLSSISSSVIANLDRGVSSKGSLNSLGGVIFILKFSKTLIPESPAYL